MLSGGKPPFPTCEFSYLDWLRVGRRILQQNKAELIDPFAMPATRLGNVVVWGAKGAVRFPDRITP